MTNENNNNALRGAHNTYETAAEALWDAYVAGREPTSEELGAHRAAFEELMRVSQDNAHNRD